MSLGKSNANVSRFRWLTRSLSVFGLVVIGLILYGKTQEVDVLQGLSAHINDRLQQPQQVESVAISTSVVAIGAAVVSGQLAHPALTEASGLAISTRDQDVLFAINDSGNEPRLFALDHTGKDLGTWLIDGVDNIDWEDLASFELDNKHYLLIADTGDNMRWRSTMHLYMVETPDLAATSKEASLPVAWQVEFQFEHGPRDSEAIAVDVSGMQVLLLAKRVIPPQVYRLPLKPDSTQQRTRHIARQIGVVSLPRPTNEDLRQDPLFGQYQSQPTAMDINGNRLVILTYKDAWLFTRLVGQDWSSALQQVPGRITLPSIHQQEAVALGDQGRRLWFTGEQASSKDATPLMVVELLGAQ
ncbi:MAG: hypothetical protein ACJAW7_002978 [Candidatus Azotimanducaceae bacterium]